MPATSSTSEPTTPPLCDACGSRPAKNFICQIIHGTQTNRSLCDECARAEVNPDNFDLTNIHEAKCYYCGDKAASGSMNHPWELPSRQQQMHYTCLRCMGLYHEFFLPALKELPSDLSPENQVQLMTVIVQQVDDRVKQAVA